MPSDSRRSRKLSMILLPICDCRLKLHQGNWQSAIENKNPALNNAGLQKVCRFFGFVVSNCPSCLAACFTWPQVALTHHVLRLRLYAWRRETVKSHNPPGLLRVGKNTDLVAELLTAFDKILRLLPGPGS